MATFTELGTPSYVAEGYVSPGYQAYLSTDHNLPVGSPPMQGIAFLPPQTPPNWPTLPPTLPPSGSPTGSSYWIAGPTEAAGEQIGFNPPVEATVDDGIRFPASPNDLILVSQWHGIPSTLNPGNIANYQDEIAAVIAGAISGLPKEVGYDITIVGSEQVTYVVTTTQPNWAEISAKVNEAINNQIMQGTNLWYELALKPVTNGPFTGGYVVNTAKLLIPQTINLAAASSGG
jgi:hypothetical protein